MRLSLTIGERLNTLLAVCNVKQKELASYLGVTDNTISYFCSGKRTPNLQQIIEISKYFNVSTDYLLGISDNATVDTDLQAVCKYTALSQKAIEIIVQNKSIEQQYSIVSKVIESEEFWDIIGILKNATVNKEFLKPNGTYVKQSIVSKLREDPISTEFRQALELIGVMGLSSAYKQQLTEEAISLFNRLFEEKNVRSDQNEE